MTGTVIRNTGSFYTVATDDGRELQAKIKGNFRLKGIRTTNPVAVGDRVRLDGDTGTLPFITSIEPRKNYIIRRASNLSKEAHIIAANVDEAYLVVTLFHPVTSTTFIDRFLCHEDQERTELLDAVSYLYRSIGYPVIHTSTLTGEGIDSLRDGMAGKVSLLSGNSGVGKSSLINCLIPGIGLRTAELSLTHDTGMHTTTFSEMFALPAGGYIIDTPGVKGFGTIDFDAAEVGHYFPEIFKASAGCRYNNCTHTHEPGCAVREALDNQTIAQSRYASYLSILADSSPDKYRKPF